MRSALLVSMALATLSIQKGESVRCFVCSSERDPTCKDPFRGVQHEHQLTHCTADSMRNVHETIPGVFFNLGYPAPTADQFVCVKAVTRDNGHELVVRSCAIPRPDTFDVCSQLRSRDLSFCQTCSGDSCNGAPATASAATGLLAAAAAALLACAAAPH